MVELLDALRRPVLVAEVALARERAVTQGTQPVGQPLDGLARARRVLGRTLIGLARMRLEQCGQRLDDELIKLGKHLLQLHRRHALRRRRRRRQKGLLLLGIGLEPRRGAAQQGRRDAPQLGHVHLDERSERRRREGRGGALHGPLDQAEELMRVDGDGEGAERLTSRLILEREIVRDQIRLSREQLEQRHDARAELAISLAASAAHGDECEDHLRVHIGLVGAPEGFGGAKCAQQRHV